MDINNSIYYQMVDLLAQGIRRVWDLNSIMDAERNPERYADLYIQQMTPIKSQIAIEEAADRFCRENGINLRDFNQEVSVELWNLENEKFL